MSVFAGCGVGLTKEMVKRILLGQALAFLNSITGISTAELANDNASYAVLQCATAYLFIFVFYGPAFLFVLYKFRNTKFANFKFFNMWWKYAILAFVDLEANYVIVLAYQYTNMMSIQLLDCFTVPCVLVLSFFVLKMKFAVTHIIGGVVAIGGLVLLITLDADGLSRSEGGGSREVLGDILCLISSALYAVSNVLTELFVKPEKQANLFTCCRKPDDDAAAIEGPPGRHETTKTEPMEHVGEEGNLDAVEELPKVPAYIPVIENLAVMSLFAGTFATIQFFAAEWKTFKPNRGAWSSWNWLFQIVFGLTMLLLYTAMPVCFIISSAAFVNISLLTADIYSIIWNVTIFKIYPTKWFFVSYIIIVVGILLYNLSDVIRIPFCARWNYPCGDPFADLDAKEGTDADHHSREGSMGHPARQLSTLPNGEDLEQKDTDGKGERFVGTGEVDSERGHH